MAYTGKTTVWQGYLRAGLCALFLNSAVMAADDMSPASLLKQSIQLLEAGKKAVENSEKQQQLYGEAASMMYMYLDTVIESEAPRVVKIAQDIRFKLAGILVQTDRLEEAAEVLQNYIDLPMGKYPRVAMKMLSTCYYELEDFKNCVTAINNALEYNENPIVIARAVAAKGVAEVSDKGEADPEYTPEELIMLYMTLGESYFGLEKWAEAIEPFTYVIENTPNSQRKGYAIMQVVNSLIKIPDFDRITAWIPKLYRTTARYDIRVNLALMNAAAALYDAEEYDSALPLYRMILPRDELIEFQQGKLRDMRMGAGLAPDEGATATAGEMELFGIVEEEEAPVEEGAEVDPSDGKPKELIELERLIDALEKLPPYENDIDYRMGLIYKAVDRYWEALEFFGQVYETTPEGDLGERSIYELVSVLLENLDEVTEAETRGYAYMGGHHEGMTPRQIAYMLTGHYQKNKTMEPLKALSPYLDGFVRTNDTTIVKFDAELYFMQAVADLMLLNYESSEKGFKRVLDEFPDSHQEGNSIYWYGMSMLFLQKYADAAPVFDQYISKFPTGDWVDEAYFQGGVCLFGMEKYDEARERFTLVIKNYPDSSIFPGACSMRGDLYGAEGDLDHALADYKMAMKSARKAKQAGYAVFQMADIYEQDESIEGRYDKIIQAVEDYLEKWKDEADIAKALFWIGKTKLQQGFVDEAVKTYINAIVEYGSDVQQDGVDMMITELVKISNIWLPVEAQAQLVDDLQRALNMTDDLTLQLRLRVTMAKLDNTELELGKTLLTELPDLKNASPPVLAALCDASFEMEDYSRSKELLDIFITRFEDSDYMRAAYKLRGFGQYAEQDYEGTLETIEEAQELYGHDRDVVWAQLLKAQVLLDQGKVEEADEANKYVLNIPGWRGVPVAQATYQMGQVAEKVGDFSTAHGFYQRTYFQYKGHAGGYWAAEGYLSAARCLKKMGRENDRRNTYRAMLFDPYVNDLPQAEEAREVLGTGEVAEIETYIATGGSTNITVEIETEKPEVTANVAETETVGTEVE